MTDNTNKNNTNNINNTDNCYKITICSPDGTEDVYRQILHSSSVTRATE